MLHPACVLDASLTVAEAVQRLRVHGGLRFALVRRQRGVRVSWHAFERSGLLRTLSEMPPERSLEEAGTEHRLFAEPEEVLQAKRVTRRQTDSSRAVLLDGDRLLGWLQPEGATERGGAHPVPSGEERRTSVPASSTGAGDVEYFRGGEEVVRASGARSPRWFADGEPVPPSARTSDAFYGFPRLIAPTSVSAGERFEVTVGLANRPVRGVAGTAVVIRDLAPGTREIELEVQVVAEGFAAPEGWRHPLRIVLAEPEAAELRVPLIALETTRETRLGCIDVHFSHLGVPCGSARRHVAIRGAGTPDAGSGTGQIWTRSRAAVGELRVPFGEAAPDLTVWITKPDGN
ncbi:MAG TPA: TCAD7 domain-containing protein, partial [Longimicrobiaceae bacterium]|nr:TCAD7 domain-containing protein [Longimicrobiaceae bacterium]